MMTGKFATLVKIIWVGIVFSPFVVRAEAIASTRNRISELFIWKTSEELKLNVSEERAFTDFSRDLNNRRNKVNDEIQENIKKLSEAKEAKAKSQLIASYRAKLNVYNQLQLEEVDKINKLLGTEKAAQYFVYKNEFAVKLKNMLSTQEGKSEDNKAKPAPRIIEDK